MSPSVRVLFCLAAALTLHQGVSVEALTSPTRSQANPSHIELKSSGSFSQIRAEASEDAKGPDEAWPETAHVDGEVQLDRLRGGTHPEKVKIGSTVFVRKKVLQGDSHAIIMEALTNELYKAAGVKSVPSCRYYPAPTIAASFAEVSAKTDHGHKRRDKERKASILCRFIDGLDPVYQFTDDVRKALSENFVLDAVFANYDVGGEQGYAKDRFARGNVGWDKDHKIVRVDNGGSLAADGLGDWKNTEYKCKDRVVTRMSGTWSREPFQLWDFQRVSAAYTKLKKEDIVAQALAVVAKEKDILAAVDNFMGGAATEKVKATLQARLQCLGRIAKDKPDLFDSKYVQIPGYDRELPTELCDGVRKLCADLL